MQIRTYPSIWLTCLSLVFCWGFFTHCTSTTKTQSTATAKSANEVDKATLNNPANRELVDLLRQQPGLNITGTGSNVRITIRGAKALERDNSPLYVVNGTPVGREYYGVASAVNVENVASIRILKGAQASIYGSQGAFGVISIKTK